MSINLSKLADLADELSLDTSTMVDSNTYYNFDDVLQFNPVHIIFDNQSDVAVEISRNGSSTWKTFTAGEALVLDMRGNSGIADNFTFSLGLQFSGKASAAGSGDFKISYTYAVE